MCVPEGGLVGKLSTLLRDGVSNLISVNKHSCLLLMLFRICCIVLLNRMYFFM